MKLNRDCYSKRERGRPPKLRPITLDSHISYYVFVVCILLSKVMNFFLILCIKKKSRMVFLGNMQTLLLKEVAKTRIGLGMLHKLFVKVLIKYEV
nr:hypothetical protein [Tanacetum cinerariifolium]